MLGFEYIILSLMLFFWVMIGGSIIRVFEYRMALVTTQEDTKGFFYSFIQLMLWPISVIVLLWIR